MLFVVVGLMYSEWIGAATLAFWLFIAAALTDWLDGYLARKANQVSTFGRFMDAVIDKVMVRVTLYSDAGICDLGPPDGGGFQRTGGRSRFQW